MGYYQKRFLGLFLALTMILSGLGVGGITARADEEEEESREAGLYVDGVPVTDDCEDILENGIFRYEGNTLFVSGYYESEHDWLIESDIENLRIYFQTDSALSGKEGVIRVTKSTVITGDPDVSVSLYGWNTGIRVEPDAEGVVLKMTDLSMTVSAGAPITADEENYSASLLLKHMDLSAKGTEGFAAIRGFAGGTSLKKCQVTKPQGGTIGADSRTETNEPAYWVEIERDEPSEYYELYVCDRQVTDINADDILGDGSVSFDGDHTLTLRKDITDTEHSSIIDSDVSDLVIEVERDVTLTAKEENGNCLSLGCDTTIQGTGKLTVTGYSGINIYNNADVTFNRMKLMAEGVYAIQGENHSIITFNNCEATITSDSYAIYLFDDIVLNGCAITVPENAKIAAPCIKDADDNSVSRIIIRRIGWQQDAKGWWYQYADGSYPKSMWKKIDSKWYHFDKSGYRQTGWYKEGDIYYYFKADGTMAADEWVEDDKYYLDADGKWVKGKVKEFEPGWRKDSKGWWYENADHTYPKNQWKKIDGKWYHFDKSGYRQTGWYKEGGVYYYFKEDGVMAADEWVEDNKYYLDENGKWVKDKEYVKPAAYDLYFGDLQVDERNRSDILGNGVFSFDGDHTLTVHGNYHLTGTNEIESWIDGLVINVTERSVLYHDDEENVFACNADTTFTGAGHLELVGGGIWTSSDLTIRDAFIFLERADIVAEPEEDTAVLHIMNSTIDCMGSIYGFDDVIFTGFFGINPEGAVYDPEKHAFVDPDNYYPESIHISGLGYGQWQVDSRGYWYEYADGTIPKDKWEKIDGYWYHFDKDGYIQTGWYQEGGAYYYLNEDGSMATDVWVENDKYYVDANGRWVKGKVKEFEAGWREDSKGWWYENEDHSYPKNQWKKIDGDWYHFDKNGYRQTGWYKEGSYYYYLKEDGVMAVNEWVDGDEYFVDENGHWVKEAVK